MYTGKFEGERGKPAKYTGTSRRTSGRPTGRLAAMALATVLLLALTIGGTVAWLTSKTSDITNTFTPSQVACAVNENFNEATGVKSQVNVTNVGDTDAFIRVRLVTYRTNDSKLHIGGAAEVPVFAPGNGWVKYGDYYYYTKPVAPGEMPENALIESIPLKMEYQDADGGHQAMDVMAEAIQSQPEAAVKEAWGAGFSINQNGTLVVPTT